MGKYAKIQLIPWEVYTGPVFDGQWRAVDYAGIKRPLGDRRWDVLSQCVDISARCAFTQMAVERAFEAADASGEVLKIFIAPEFLYRGGGGAYLHDLINGWSAACPFSDWHLPLPYGGPWPGLFGSLRALVAEERFKDWLFVFGTAVSAGFRAHNGMILRVGVGESAGGAPPPAVCFNNALIQCGGWGPLEAARAPHSYVTGKHLQSGIDFIEFSLEGCTVNDSGNVEPANDQSISVLDNMLVEEGSAVMGFPHIRHLDGSMIKFGVEICLDHAACGGRPGCGRLAYWGERVDIQLVLSCGMTLRPHSVSLRQHNPDTPDAYAFNCDGLVTLRTAQDGYGTHLQLWAQDTAGACHTLMEVGNGCDPDDPDHIPVGESVTVTADWPTDAVLLCDPAEIPGYLLWASMGEPDPGAYVDPSVLSFQWPAGAGYVRPLPPLDLSPEGGD